MATTTVVRKAAWIRPLCQGLAAGLRRQSNRQMISVERSVIYNLYKNVSGNQIVGESSKERNISSHKIQVNGVDLHFDITGTGRNAILLVPGALGCSKTDFKLQLQNMDKDLFTIIGFDPRGYGRSVPPERDWPEHFLLRDAEDAAQLMKNLGFHQYSLLGWSDGGIAALMMAARYPERVRKLVVWGANAYVTEDEVKSYEKIRSIDNWSQPMRGPYLDVYNPEYLRKHFSLWVDAYNVYLKKRGGDICRSDLEKICCPTLVLHGEKDPLVPRFHPEFLNQNIKNSRLEVFPTGRHNIHQHFYKEFNSDVEHFLLSVD